MAVMPSSLNASENGPWSNAADLIVQVPPSSHMALKSIGNASRASPEADQEPLQIKYRHLTFETIVPNPSSVSSSHFRLRRPVPISPFEWSPRRKLFTTCLSCAVTVISGYASGSYNPPNEQMGAEWNVSQVAILVGTTTYCVGFAIAPMVLAPFSEINGRKPVFVGSGIVFALSQLGCAVTNSYAGMLIARFWAGVGSSTFSTMVGGIIADIYRAKDRNTPMAAFCGSAFLGTGLGPLLSAIVTQHAPWRWVFYVQAIACGVLALATAVCLEETRESVLLSHKAKILNDWYDELEKAGCESSIVVEGDDEKRVKERIRWKVEADEQRETLLKMVGISLYRPFHLLLTEPVVFWFSAWIAFAWGVLYLSFASLPLVFGTTYNWGVQDSGLVFAAMTVGGVLAAFLSIYQNKIVEYYDINLPAPEGRLYFCCIEAALMPIGLFWFAWTAFAQVPWIVPMLAIGCVTIGLYTIFLAVNNYTADTYHRYASSALAAEAFCRNIFGAVFPLATDALYKRLTYAGATSLLGGISTLLTVVPWVLVLYGPRIRARSKIAREIMR